MDSYELAHFCGTNTAFFIPSLRDIAGFQTGILSEDTPTGAIINEFGWQCVFVDQALAVGTVKESASDTMLQRFRWVCGNGLQFLFRWRFWCASSGFLNHGGSMLTTRLARFSRLLQHQSNGPVPQTQTRREEAIILKTVILVERWYAQ